LARDATERRTITVPNVASSEGGGFSTVRAGLAGSRGCSAGCGCCVLLRLPNMRAARIVSQGAYGRRGRYDFVSLPDIVNKK
jgi:hypothetical protein